MDWFSKIKEAVFSPQQAVQAETQELKQTVDIDRKELQKSVPKPIIKSTLSPFASRILEKAKIESLKDDSERKRMTSPTQLFMTNEEAKNRVGHIQSIALERAKIESNKYTQANHPKQDSAYSAFIKRNTPQKDK